MSTLRRASAIARTDFRRGARKYRRNWPQGLFSAAVILLLAVAAGYAGSVAGPLLAEGALDTDLFSAAETLRGLVALFWLVGVLVFAIRALGQRGVPTDTEGLLTAVSTRDATLGMLAAETGYVLLWLVPFGLGGGLGMAYATGSYGAVVTVPLAVVLLGVTAALVGYPLGMAVRHVVTRFAFVARHKAALVVVAFLAYFALVFSGVLNGAMVALFEPMQAVPLGWFGDLLLLGVGAGAAPALALASLGVAAVIALASVAVTTAVADRHWFADPALAGAVESAPAEVTGPSRVEAALAGPLGRPTAAVVALAWRRAARAPMKLLYAFYPLLLLTGVVAEVLQTGLIPAYLPYAVLLLAAWIGAVVFTLNPLGDQGAVLPTTLLSRLDGRRFVLAHVAAGLAVAIPIGMALTAAVGLFSPLDRTTVLALTAAAPVVMVATALLAVGLGTAFPRYEAVSVTRSMKAVVPSAWAFVLFSLYLLAVAAAGAVAYEPLARAVAAGLLTWLLPFGLAVEGGTLLPVSVGLLAVLAALPLASWRYAVRRFDRLTLA